MLLECLVALEGHRLAGDLEDLSEAQAAVLREVVAPPSYLPLFSTPFSYCTLSKL